jgi:hypothetical protein
MKSFTIILTAVTMTAAATAVLAADSKKKTTSVQSPESIECSKQADAKGLHGAERIKFRANCKKELKAKAATTPPAAPPASTETKTETPPTKNQ